MDLLMICKAMLNNIYRIYYLLPTHKQYWMNIEVFA